MKRCWDYNIFGINLSNSENEEISKVYNQRDVEKIIREINEENPDMNGKELKAKAQEYLEEQAEKEHNLPGNRSRR